MANTTSMTAKELEPKTRTFDVWWDAINSMEKEKKPTIKMNLDEWFTLTKELFES